MPANQTAQETTESTLEWKKFSNLELHWPDWLIKDVLPRESLICIFGQRGKGKTFLALDWACSIATGNDWLGHPIGHPISPEKPRSNRIAYVLAERPDGLLRRIHGWIMHSYDIEHDKDAQSSKEMERLVQDKGKELFDIGEGRFFFAEIPHRIDESEELDKLCRKLKEIEPIDLIVLDPMISFMDGNENEARDMQRLVEGLREISSTFHCSVLVVHHEGKKANGARGSSALEAGMDTILNLKGVNQHRTIIEMTKQREAAEMPDIEISFKSQEYSEDKPLGKFPQMVTNTKPQDRPHKTNQKSDKTPQPNKALRKSDIRCKEENDAIKQAIKQLQREGNATVDTILECVGKSMSISRSTLNSRIKKLDEDGHISSPGKIGKTFIYTIP
ncbi:AAA family ATPase [Tepidicaulis sp.]|uniref:AAA family ATPase n=1 Tax=Tepidicaulis sp. TaxID=1920809 RepID=UPI003B5AB8DD